MEGAKGASRQSLVGETPEYDSGTGGCERHQRIPETMGVREATERP